MYVEWLKELVNKGIYNIHIDLTITSSSELTIQDANWKAAGPDGVQGQCKDP